MTELRNTINRVNYNNFSDPNPTAKSVSSGSDETGNSPDRFQDNNEEHGKGSDTPAFRLMDNILGRQNYDKRVRPTSNSSSSVIVTFRMNLYQILDVIEPPQTVVIHAWVTQMWHDEFLGWDPSKYGGIDWAVVPFAEIWLPDTFLYNGLEMSQSSTEHLINVLLETKNDTGKWVASVRLMYPAIYHFSCKMQVAMFPFDIQRCNVTIGSWTHDMAAINYTTESERVMLENYVSHDEWSLLSFNWLREEVKFSCCPVPWVLLHAQLHIQRKPLFYLVNLVLPSVVITLVALAGFYMPSSTTGERAEKFNLGITTLLAMAILLLMVVDSMPSTSESIPLIGIFYLIIIIVISLGTLITAIIILIQKKGEYGCTVSDCGRSIAVCAAKCLGINARPELIEHWQRLRLQKRQCNDDDKDNGRLISKTRRFQSSDMSPVQREQYHKVCEELGVSAHDLGHFQTRKQPSEERSEAEEDRLRCLEWEFVADVIDRAMLFVFTTAVLGVTAMTIGVGLTYQEYGAIG